MVGFYLKCLVLVALALLLQYAVGEKNADTILPKIDLETQAKSLKTPGAFRVGFLGDSTIATVAHTDTDHESISDKFLALNPGIRVLKMDNKGWHTEVQRDACRYLHKQGADPDLWILPVNLRAFSFGWSQSPNLSFMPGRIRWAYDDWLPPQYYRPLSVFKWVNPAPKSVEEFNVELKQYRQSLARQEKGWDDRKRDFFESYTQPIAPDHPRLQALRELLELYKGSKTRVLVYLVPLDYGWGMQELGEAFRAPVESNVALLAKLCREQQALFLDLHSALGPERFSWQEEGVISEHVDAQGRAMVAHWITQELRKGSQ